jgi:peroxiredoxin
MQLLPLRALAVAALLCGLTGCARPAPPVYKSTLKDPAKRNPAPDFTLRDSNGKTVRLADYRGQVVLLNFWATWCGPCKAEIPWFIEFQKSFKDKGFTVLGVALDDDGWDSVKPYLEHKQMNYPVVLGSPQVEAAYGGIESVPTSFVIDRQGRIASVHIGLITKDVYEADIQQLLP